MLSKVLRFVFKKTKEKRRLLSLALIKRRSKRIFKQESVEFGMNTFGNKFQIQNFGTINLGDNVFLNSFPNGSSFPTSLNTYYPESRIIIGNNCRINGTIFHCNKEISIGNHCLFGPGTVIVDNDSHRISIDYAERRKEPTSKPIVIEENVWIGMNSVILKGVQIGENSIIASGSIVTKSVPKNCLFGGNPAKLIKKLT